MPQKMSKTQNFENHAKFYPFHHFVIMPLALIFFIWTIIRTDFSNSDTIIDSIYFLLPSFLILLISVLARLYAIKNQDRVIRLEMRQRYFHLTGTTLYDTEDKLSSAQLIALRFAGDNELLALIDKTIKENTAPKEIKKSIKNWKPDHHRV
jgi:hypothetical protein